MTEEEARDRLLGEYGEAVVSTLQRYVDLVLDANQIQNLIAKTTEQLIWSRHILDSAQLAKPLRGRQAIVDIGSGAGLPGIILAILLDSDFTLVEPRRRRAEFLDDVIRSLKLRHASVVTGKIETVTNAVFDAAVARAYAPLSTVFTSARHVTCAKTLWVLPKGRSVHHELALAKETWQGMFHVERSITDPDAGIVIARNVEPRRP